MSATDKLRRLLDERGVPYETNDDMGASETRWNGFTAYQLTPNAKLMMHPTPEQAIAATLGSGNKSRWHELFGTPERAAETLKRMDVDACNWCVNSSGNPEDCRACPYKYDYYGCYLPEKFSMLVWLKSEVVE